MFYKQDLETFIRDNVIFEHLFFFFKYTPKDMNEWANENIIYWKLNLAYVKELKSQGRRVVELETVISLINENEFTIETKEQLIREYQLAIK